jgi:hypothetical protein
MRTILQAGLACATLAFAVNALAAPADAPVAAAAAGFVDQNAVAPASLDKYRGGFTDPSGFAVSLGIDRIVTINGNVAATSSMNFGDLGSLASGKTTLSADSQNQLNLIQNGGGTFNVQLGSGAVGGTVIQNSLNNQIINNATIINASVDTRGMLQAMNFQSTLSNALNTAATGR